MKLFLLAAVAGLAMTTGAAQTQTQTPTELKSQVGLYLTPVFSRISNSTADPGLFAFLGMNNTSRVFEGFGIGVYDDLFHAPSFDAGVDVRLNILRGGGAQLTTFLVGGRVAFKPANLRLKPYVQASVGLGSSHTATNPVSSSKFEYQVAGGLDYTIATHVDWRALELGYGGVQTINSFSFNGQTQPTSRLLNFSTGLVFRFK